MKIKQEEYKTRRIFCKQKEFNRDHQIKLHKHDKIQFVPLEIKAKK